MFVDHIGSKLLASFAVKLQEMGAYPGFAGDDCCPLKPEIAAKAQQVVGRPGSWEERAMLLQLLGERPASTLPRLLPTWVRSPAGLGARHQSLPQAKCIPTASAIPILVR